MIRFLVDASLALLGFFEGAVEPDPAERGD